MNNEEIELFYKENKRVDIETFDYELFHAENKELLCLAEEKPDYKNFDKVEKAIKDYIDKICPLKLNSKKKIDEYTHEMKEKEDIIKIRKILFGIVHHKKNLDLIKNDTLYWLRLRESQELFESIITRLGHFRPHSWHYLEKLERIEIILRSED